MSDLRREVLDMCWDYLMHYIADDAKSNLSKEEIIKDILKLKPDTKSLEININYKDIHYSKVFNFKYERNEYPELNTWRVQVFKRDGFKCVKCGSKNKIQAHHLKRWKDYPDDRFNVGNGQTLCFKCHCKTDNYGRKNNAIC